MYSSYVKRYKNVGIDIATTPFEIAPAPHTSLGGVVVDRSCSTEIEGLFACGEVIGGLHGANRAGGNAGLETLVFGTIAGKSAAEFLAHESHPDYVPSKLHCDNFVNSVIGRVSDTALDTEAVAEIRGQLETILDRKLSVLRCGEDLESAKRELSAMLDRITAMDTDMADAKEIYDLIRLENDVTTAYLLALSCLERDMSIGCHVRSDCPEADADSEKYRVNVKYGKSGATVKKVPLH